MRFKSQLGDLQFSLLLYQKRLQRMLFKNCPWDSKHLVEERNGFTEF